MAKGFPDWFGHSIFPVYGAFNEESGSYTQLASAASELVFTVTGKGVIRGGLFFTSQVGVDGDLEISPSILIDQSTSIDIYFGANYPVAAQYRETPYGKIVSLEYLGGDVMGILKGEIPFITQFKLYMWAKYTGAAPVTIYDVQYSLYQ